MLPYVAVEKAEQKFTLVRSFQQLFNQGILQLKALDNNVVFIVLDQLRKLRTILLSSLFKVTIN